MNSNLPQSVTNSLRSSQFLGGLAVGSVLTLILSNQDVQRALFRGMARVATVARSGMEEMKERFHDAEAEVAMEETVEDMAEPADKA